MEFRGGVENKPNFQSAEVILQMGKIKSPLLIERRGLQMSKFSSSYLSDFTSVGFSTLVRYWLLDIIGPIPSVALDKSCYKVVPSVDLTISDLIPSCQQCF
jgi:hypothetical protein